MIDFTRQLRTTCGHHKVRVADHSFRSRGFGPLVLCIIALPTHDEPILVQRDGTVVASQGYAKIENTPTYTYVDVYEDGQLSFPRDQFERGKPSTISDKRTVRSTITINNLTGGLEITHVEPETETEA